MFVILRYLLLLILLGNLYFFSVVLLVLAYCILFLTVWFPGLNLLLSFSMCCMLHHIAVVFDFGLAFYIGFVRIDWLKKLVIDVRAWIYMYYNIVYIVITLFGFHEHFLSLISYMLSSILLIYKLFSHFLFLTIYYYWWT